ncbi:MAG: protein kinase [Candidatus Obscuribacterales bacterium]
MGLEKIREVDSPEHGQSIAAGAEPGALHRRLVGTTVHDTYTIDEVLSLSDSSAVFLATEDMSDKRVVLKTPFAQTESNIAALEERVKALMFFNHNNVVPFLNYRRPYYAMEYLGYMSLAKVTGRAKPIESKDKLFQLLVPIVRAMSAAHESGITHGALCPEDIFLVKQNNEFVVKVAGFASIKEEKAGLLHDLAAFGKIVFLCASGRSLDDTVHDPFPQPLSRYAPGLHNSQGLDNLIIRALGKIQDCHFESFEEVQSALDYWYNAEESAVIEEPEPSSLFRSRLLEISASELEDEAETAAALQDTDESTPIFDQKPVQEPGTSLTEDTVEEEVLVSEKVEAPAEAPAEEQNAVDPDQDPLIGQVLFDRYVVLDRLSKGRTATVFVASDMIADRVVAMKTLNDPEMESVLDFAREIEQKSSIQHPSLVQFLDYQQTMTHPFYVMEFVEAPTLSELLDLVKRTETEEQIASAALQICDILSVLHRSGGIHGNITADSVLILEEAGNSLVKLAGLGTRQARFAYYRDLGSADGYIKLAEYEQIKDSTKVDIHDTAVVLYQMATGRLPYETFSGDSLTTSGLTPFCEKVAFLRPDLFAVEVLDSIIERAFDKDNPNKFQNIEQLREAISEWIEATREELSDEDHSPMSDELTSGVRRWTSDLKDLRNLEEEREERLALKSTQVKSEKTIGMQLTKVIAVKGRRKSPVRAIAELIFSILAIGAIVFAGINYVTSNFESLKKSYLQASRQLSSRVALAPGEGASGTAQAGIETLDSFDYKQSPIYKRWTKTREVGKRRRIDETGKLREKW